MKKQKKSQSQLILDYIDMYGELKPVAVMKTYFQGYFMGTSLDRRCRKLKENGILDNKEDSEGYAIFFRRKAQTEMF